MKMEKRKNVIIRDVLYFFMADYASWKALMGSPGKKQRPCLRNEMQIGDGRESIDHKRHII